MSYLVRKINSQTRWIVDDRSWLGPQDAPSAILKDFDCKNNSLSVWKIDDSEQNLNRLLAALGAINSQHEHLEYVVFSDEVISQASIESSPVRGDAPDEEVNEWHLDLVNLTVNQVANLATLIWLSPTTETRVLLVGDLEDLIISAVKQSRIAVDSLSKNVKRKILPRLT